MSDHLTSRESKDRARIDVNAEHEVRYWTHELGVSENDLRKLVATHGPVAGIVKAATRAGH